MSKTYGATEPTQPLVEINESNPKRTFTPEELKKDLKTTLAKSVVLAKYCEVGLPNDECVRLQESKVVPAEDGEIVVRMQYLTLDPAHRFYMRKESTNFPVLPLGRTIPTFGTGVVVESKHPKFKVGQHVTGGSGLTTYCTIKPERSFFTVLPDDVAGREPEMLDLLSITGVTAYFGVTEIAKPKKGNVAVVSGASGTVGSIAGQILKILGCRVIGIAGGADKCKWLKEIGFDDTIDYKVHNGTKSMMAALREKCPEIDIYFDNVGGYILDAVLPLLAMHARIVYCGHVTSYSEDEYGGPKNYRYILYRAATYQGLLFTDYSQRFDEAFKHLVEWKLEKKIVTRKALVVKSLKNYLTTWLKIFGDGGHASAKPALDVMDD